MVLKTHKGHTFNDLLVNRIFQKFSCNFPALLTKKEWPEGRFICIDYDLKHGNRVKSLRSPTRQDEIKTTIFSQTFEPDGAGWTEVSHPGGAKTIYHFDADLQLTSIEQYIHERIYRIQKRFWDKEQDVSNLIATSLEDGQGAILYYKSYAYDVKNTGNIVKEVDYGNLTGANPGAVVLDQEGVPEESQESHQKTYSYATEGNFDVVHQTDGKGNGLKLSYKKGTNLLLEKAIFAKQKRKKRWFYKYNDEGSLIQVIVDDHDGAESEYFYNATERHITNIFPKRELPYIGAPEIIEEKCVNLDQSSEILLKKTVNHFDSQGHLASQDFYDAKGVFQYSIKKHMENSLLMAEIDPLGHEIRYAYDLNHNLLLEEHVATGTSKEYGYDVSNRLVYTAEKDGSGHSFETYFSYDLAGNKISETDALGNQTTYTHDKLGRVLSITYPAISDGTTSSIRPIYWYGYDLFDNLISITDPKGKITQKTYNVRHQPTSIQYPDRTQELFKYDPEGSLHRYSGRNGLIQIFEYDDLGRVTHIEYHPRGSTGQSHGYKNDYFGYNAFHLIEKQDDQGKVSYAYDSAGRLSSTAAPLNQFSDDTEVPEPKLEFFYDSFGRTEAIKQWKGAKTFTLQVKEYDLLDRVIEARVENEKGVILVKHRYVYNDQGQLSSMIGYPNNQESVLAQYGYDGFGRLLHIRDALNQETKIVYDDLHSNKLGQRVLKSTTIDPLGNQEEEIFDSSSHLVKRAKKNHMGQLLSETEWVYDNCGNKIAQTDAVLHRNHPSKYTTSWSYDCGNRLRSYKQADEASDVYTTTFTYNAYGDLSAVLQPGFKDPLLYEFNDRGELSFLDYLKPQNSKASYQYFYDGRSHLENVLIGDTHILSWEKDADGQILTETVDDSWDSYTVTYMRNRAGLINRIKLPDGSWINYAYDGPFVKSVTRKTADKKEQYCYEVISRDLMGHCLEEKLIGLAGTRKQTWDKAARKTAILTDFFQDRVPEGGYDPLYNICKREILLNTKPSTICYEYNGLSRLVFEQGEKEHRYTYDSLGNRLQKDESAYKHNYLNQLLEAENTSYTFDGNGNLATKTIGGKTWLYQSNSLNQLISVKDSDQNLLTFTYDHSGRRLTKQIETRTKKTKIYRYFYVGQTELGCLDENGTIIELKVPTDPNDETSPSIAIEHCKEIYAPLYDLQGNIICLIDSQRRKISENYQYTAFGEEQIFDKKGQVVTKSSTGNAWRYQGKRIDPETGLIYFGQRYYDPKIGRWISPDPAGNIDGPNLYVFARNNPMTYVDYFGFASEVNNNQEKEFLDYFYGEFEPPCQCEQHRSCKRGGDISSALSGISHGAVDFFVGSLHELQTMATYMGLFEMELALQERMLMIDAMEQSQANQMAALEGWVMGMLGIDPSDAIYGSFRANTKLGLEVASLVSGGYGAIKGVVGLSRLARAPVQIAGTARSLLIEPSAFNKAINANQIWSSTKKKTAVQNAFRHWKDHGHEFPTLQNAKQYVESTKTFTQSPPKGTLTITRPNGDTVFYNPSSNTFAVIDQQGLPRTMYKPNPSIHNYPTNLDYFYGQ